MTEEEIKSLIAEAVEAKDAGIERLKNKNSELIGKSKKARDEADAAKTAAESAAEEAARKAGDVEKLERQLTDKFNKQIGDLTASRDEAVSKWQGREVDALFANSFREHNVLADASDIIRDAFAAKVQWIDGAPLIGDAPASEALAAYFKSDKAKPFISASGNAGVGAKVKAEALSKDTPFNLTKYTEMRKADPAAAAAWADVTGNGYLNQP